MHIKQKISSALLKALFTDDSRDSFPGKDIYPKAKGHAVFVLKKVARLLYLNTIYSVTLSSSFLPCHTSV